MLVCKNRGCPKSLIYQAFSGCTLDFCKNCTYHPWLLVSGKTRIYAIISSSRGTSFTADSVPSVRRYSDIFMPHFFAFLRMVFFSVLKTLTFISSVRLRVAFTSSQRGYRGAPLSYREIRGNWKPDGYTNPMLAILTDRKTSYSLAVFRTVILHRRPPPPMTQMTIVTVNRGVRIYRHFVPSVTQVSRSRKDRHYRQHRHSAQG